MSTFLEMVNDCIRMGLEKDDLSYPSLKSLCYRRMMEYQVENSYRLSAIFECSNLLKKHRTEMSWRAAGRPYCRKPFVSASLGVRLEGSDLIMPGGFRLALVPHTLAALQSGVQLVSATVTQSSLAVVYRKDVPPLATSGAVALDINLRNVTSFDTEGRSERYDTSELVRIQEAYRRRTSRFRRHDARIKQRIFRKHATIAHDRKAAVLHDLSSFIVHRATALRQTIVLENLKGIRAIFRKESKSSAFYLSIMNAWPFAELQRQIGYKAKWEGLPVVYVEPESTSNDCSRCGGGMKETLADRSILRCNDCGLVIDRDLNAAKNILSRASRSEAVGSADEAMVGPVSRQETKSKVDADNSTDPNEGRKKGSEHR